MEGSCGRERCDFDLGIIMIGAENSTPEKKTCLIYLTTSGLKL